MNTPDKNPAEDKAIFEQKFIEVSNGQLKLFVNFVMLPPMP